MKKLFTLFTVSLTITFAQAQVGTSSASPAVACQGTSITLASNGSYTPTSTPFWQRSTDAGVTWSNIAGATTTTVVTTTLATGTALYRYLPNATLPANATQTCTLTYDPTSAGTVNTSATVCSGINSGTLTVTPGAFTSVNNWAYSTDGGSTWTNIVNATTSQAYSNLTTTTLYRANVTNGSCPAANAAPATITVNPVSVGGTTSGAATVCAGSNSGTLTLSGYTGTIQGRNSTNGGVT